MIKGYCIQSIGGHPVTVLNTSGHAPYFLKSSKDFIKAIFETEKVELMSPTRLRNRRVSSSSSSSSKSSRFYY